jgi:hypothetical protein
MAHVLQYFTFQVLAFIQIRDWLKMNVIIRHVGSRLRPHIAWENTVRGYAEKIKCL